MKNGGGVHRYEDQCPFCACYLVKDCEEECSNGQHCWEHIKCPVFQGVVTLKAFTSFERMGERLSVK